MNISAVLDYSLSGSGSFVNGKFMCFVDFIHLVDGREEVTEAREGRNGQS